MSICLLRFKYAFLILCSLAFNPQGGYGNDFFPVTPEYSSEIASYNYASVPQGYALAAVSLQGLANRDTARILLEDNLSRWITDIYVASGNITSIKKYSNIYTLLQDFKGYFKGAVVYDPNNKFTINLATNIAGVENRVIISPDMIDNFKGYIGIDDIKDLREYNFSSRLEAYLWYEEHILPFQRHDVLAVANDHYMHDVYRDYLIEFKVPTFWLPGNSDDDYDYRYNNKIIKLFQNTPENIPVLGFWPDAAGAGLEEFSGVKLAGYYGKFTVVNTWVGNYSFHSAVRSQYSYNQKLVRRKTYREYDSAKKYVALIMIESGDSPGYMQFGFTQRQWEDPSRGQVPISYGINPAMRMLLPAVSKYLYDSATENDYFFNSISGAGYCYPFEGYGSLTSDPETTLKEYFQMTNTEMEKMDFDMLGIYTHPNTTNGKWTGQDLDIFKKYIEPMEGLNSVISGMHRTGYTGINGNEYYNDYGKNVTVHHTLTFWPGIDYTWNDTEQDQDAVDFLINEIKTSGADGKFIQAMFYSWMYGPRRLKMVQDQMEAEGYEFLTLNEFDHLYRISQGLGLAATGNTWFIRDEVSEDADFTSITAALKDPRVKNGDQLDILGTFTEEEIQLTKELSFIGHGKDNTLIQAAESSSIASGRVFYFNDTPGVEKLSFENMTIRYGNTNNKGGGICIIGPVDVSLNNVAIDENLAKGNGGGFYFEGGSLNIDQCEFTNNETLASYAGLDINMEHEKNLHVNISRSYFEGNEASEFGGAIGITKNWTMNADCSIRIQNTTFYMNKAKSGSALWFEVNKETKESNYPLGAYSNSLTNCTFVDNLNMEEGWFGVAQFQTPDATAFYAYNNLFKNNSTLYSSTENENYDLWLPSNLLQCELYNNIGSSLWFPDIYISTSRNNTLKATNSEIGLDVEPANNGGLVKTIALRKESTAISYVADHILKTDARGFPRKSTLSDCGAYETDFLSSANHIQESSMSQILAFPNPVRDVLYFSTEVKGEIILYDLNGKLLMHFPKGNYNQLSLKGLNQGLYLMVLVRNNEKVSYLKIIKS